MTSFSNNTVYAPLPPRRYGEWELYLLPLLLARVSNHFLPYLVGVVCYTVVWLHCRVGRMVGYRGPTYTTRDLLAAIALLALLWEAGRWTKPDELTTIVTWVMTAVFFIMPLAAIQLALNMHHPAPLAKDLVVRRVRLVDVWFDAVQSLVPLAAILWVAIGSTARDAEE